MRPAIGMFELISKGTHGMGLVCLGREAITGSAQRRVRAPGARLDEQVEVRLRQKAQATSSSSWLQASCRHRMRRKALNSFLSSIEPAIMLLVNVHSPYHLAACRKHVTKGTG